MDAAIRPLLDSYQLELEALEPTLGHKIEIYAKTGSARASGNGPGIRIVTPASNSVVKTNGGAATVEGVATGTHAGWQAQLEVFTDRWYVQEKVPVAADGSFHQVVYISGEGRQQCYHLLRVRLFDDAGQRRAASLNYGITRANPDGSPPSCKLKQ